jgi:hypothetical protein
MTVEKLGEGTDVNGSDRNIYNSVRRETALMLGCPETLTIIDDVIREFDDIARTSTGFGKNEAQVLDRGVDLRLVRVRDCPFRIRRSDLTSRDDDIVASRNQESM